MRYCGGKSRIAEKLAEQIIPWRKPGGRFIEPFCGGMSATVKLQPDFASDASEPLIRLIKAVRDGWDPPCEVTEEVYQDSKGSGTALEAFCGHCCSWGGKWWGGFAREDGRNFAQQGRNALLRKIEATRGVDFTACDYSDWICGEGDLLYCDPPYRGTTNGYATGPFDSDAFWAWARETADRGAVVFVSEFSGPGWAKEHCQFDSRTDLRKRGGGQASVEKLFRLGAM